MLDLSLRILGIMAPSVCLALVGFLWKKKGPDYPTEFVTTLVINLAMPALVFHTITTADIRLEALAEIGLAAVIVHSLMLALSWPLLRKAHKDQRLSVAFTVGNTGNLGLPLCLFAFGDPGLSLAIAFFSVQCIFLFTVGEAVYAGAVSFRRILKTPIIYALSAAVLVRYLELPVHSIILNTTSVLGQITVPIMLITLGVSIAGMRASNLPSTVLWAFVRTLLATVVGFSVAGLFSLEGVARGVLVLETVVPVAVFNYLLAYRYRMNSEEISGLILVTHLAALFYLPIVLAMVLE